MPAAFANFGSGFADRLHRDADPGPASSRKTFFDIGGAACIQDFGVRGRAGSISTPRFGVSVNFLGMPLHFDFSSGTSSSRSAASRPSSHRAAVLGLMVQHNSANRAVLKRRPSCPRSYGGSARDIGSTFLIDGETALMLAPSPTSSDRARRIRRVVLTTPTSTHRPLRFLIENSAAQPASTRRSAAVLQATAPYGNDVTWPDFTRLPSRARPTVFRPVGPESHFAAGPRRSSRGRRPSCPPQPRQRGRAVLFSGDTAHGAHLAPRGGSAT
jgi:hypothetical protein